MADRDLTCTDANVQSDLHALFLATPLNLAESDLQELEICCSDAAGAWEALGCCAELRRVLTATVLSALRRVAAWTASIWCAWWGGCWAVVDGDGMTVGVEGGRASSPSAKA